MQILKIRKKERGAYRTIYVPNQEEKETYREKLGAINVKAETICSDACHGFMREKSPVTNAAQHVGFEYTLSFDLENFFDSVNESHLNGKLSQEEMLTVLVDNAPRQGLPTSPAVCNIAATDLDKAVQKLKKKLDFVYTRYADDLSFSFDKIETFHLLKKRIPEIVGRCGFKLNRKKTRLQKGSIGRRIITGVAVDYQDIYPTRKIKRKIRAAEHQKNTSSLKGLKEWAKLRLPKPIDREKENKYDEFKKLCKHWKFKCPKKEELPVKDADYWIGDNCVITGDYCYILGMSSFTTSWTSCLGHKGSNRRKAIFYVLLEGCRVALLLGDKYKEFGGVRRREIKARVRVYTLRSGDLTSDFAFYGESEEAKNSLREFLRTAGVKSKGELALLLKNERKVVGNVSAKYPIYNQGIFSRKGTHRGKKVRWLTI